MPSLAKLLSYATLAGICAGSSLGRASTATTDISDMWFNAAESGWGVNLVLQNNVVFATFFIYDTNRNPVWYTAQLTQQPGTFTWSGPLYATTGPWFGGAFAANTVTVRQAGTATFNLIDIGDATLTYSVDGVVVSKSLQRQTWTNENYTGQYAGGYSIKAAGCSLSSYNVITEVAGLLSISHSGAAFSMASTSQLGTCSFSGTYIQTGKLGSVNGTYSCSDGQRGPFSMFEMTPTISGFTARVQGSNQICPQWSGYAGGIARAQ